VRFNYFETYPDCLTGEIPTSLPLEFTKTPGDAHIEDWEIFNKGDIFSAFGGDLGSTISLYQQAATYFPQMPVGMPARRVFRTDPSTNCPLNTVFWPFGFSGMFCSLLDLFKVVILVLDVCVVDYYNFTTCTPCQGGNYTRNASVIWDPTGSLCPAQGAIEYPTCGPFLCGMYCNIVFQKRSVTQPLRHLQRIICPH